MFEMIDELINDEANWSLWFGWRKICYWNGSKGSNLGRVQPQSLKIASELKVTVWSLHHVW